MAVVFQPAHHAIVRDVAPEQVAAVTEIDRPLRPAEAGARSARSPRCPASETLVQLLDARIGVAGVGEMAERQVHRVDRHRNGFSCSGAEIACKIRWRRRLALRVGSMDASVAPCWCERMTRARHSSTGRSRAAACSRRPEYQGLRSPQAPRRHARPARQRHRDGLPILQLMRVLCVHIHALVGFKQLSR